jgi:hypothetical protein
MGVGCGALGNLPDHGIVLFDAALGEFRLHFGFLSCQQGNFRVKCAIAGQLNLDAVLAGRELHGMKLSAKLADMSDVLVIEKYGSSIRLHRKLQSCCRRRDLPSRALLHCYVYG